MVGGGCLVVCAVVVDASEHRITEYNQDYQALGDVLDY